MSCDRNALRKKILGKRDELPKAVRAEKSRLILERLWDIEEVARAGTIMIYVNFRSEVETYPLFAICRQKGIRVTVPLTLTETSTLVPYPVEDPERDLRPGYCGIPEPDDRRLFPCEPEEIDVVVVPGAVFDPGGGRLGYGGGYYDRFLAHRTPRALRVALAFEMQVLDKVPVMEHDERMHYIVTEKLLRQVKG